MYQMLCVVYQANLCNTIPVTEVETIYFLIQT